MYQANGTEKNPSPREIVPVSTEIPVKAERRTFTAEYKLKILHESDHCKNGEMGALLRREGLYSSHLVTWRKERDAGRISTILPTRRGRKPNPLEAEYEKLKKQLQRTEKRLEQAQAILDAQKKLLDIFGMTPMPGDDGRNSDLSSKS